MRLPNELLDLISHHLLFAGLQSLYQVEWRCSQAETPRLLCMFGLMHAYAALGMFATRQALISGISPFISGQSDLAVCAHYRIYLKLNTVV